MRGDCSIRIGGTGFTPEEIQACAQRTGLLSFEIALESGETCQCSACQSAGVTPQSPLSIDEIHKLITQAKDEGAKRCILVDSEPVSYGELRSLIDHLRIAGLQVELFTNGTGVDASMARYLRERGVAVVIRLDSLHRDLQNRLSGREDAFDVTLSALGQLKEAGYGDGNPAVAIRIAVEPENLGEVPALWRWARGQRIEPYVQILKPRMSPKGSATIIPPLRARQLFEELERIDRLEFGKPWSTPPALTGRSCKRHQFACHITGCGTIFACVGVTIPLGNIRTESLRDILGQSEVLENLRMYGQKVKEPCRTCCKTVDCYGCRGAAFQLTGDYMAADQMCWKAAGADIPTLPVSISDLIPHGPSMRMVLHLVQVGERRAVTDYLVSADSLLVDEAGRLDESAYIEMIAQSFAASHGFHMSTEERPLHRGLLLGIKDLIVHGHAHVGDRLKIEVRKITRFGDFGVVEGTIRHEDGRVLATGQVKIWRLSDDSTKAMFT